MGILGEQLGDRVEVAVPPRSFVAADPAHHVIPVHRVSLPAAALEPVGTLSHAPPRQLVREIPCCAPNARDFAALRTGRATMPRSGSSPAAVSGEEVGRHGEVLGRVEGGDGGGVVGGAVGGDRVDEAVVPRPSPEPATCRTSEDSVRHRGRARVSPGIARPIDTDSGPSIASVSPDPGRRGSLAFGTVRNADPRVVVSGEESCSRTARSPPTFRPAT